MSQIGSQSAETSPRKQLFSLIWPGALAAQAVHCAAMLRIADHVADGKDCVETLAASTQAHPVALQRLLRALCSLGILNEQSGNRYQLTEMGEALQTGIPVACIHGQSCWELPLYGVPGADYSNQYKQGSRHSIGSLVGRSGI